MDLRKQNEKHGVRECTRSRGESNRQGAVGLGGAEDRPPNIGPAPQLPAGILGRCAPCGERPKKGASQEVVCGGVGCLCPPPAGPPAPPSSTLWKGWWAGWGLCPVTRPPQDRPQPGWMSRAPPTPLAGVFMGDPFLRLAFELRSDLISTQKKSNLKKRKRKRKSRKGPLSAAQPKLSKAGVQAGRREGGGVWSVRAPGSLPAARMPALCCPDTRRPRALQYPDVCTEVGPLVPYI